MSDSCGDSYALDADKLQILIRCAIDLEAQLNGFPDALVDLVEGLPLRMAPWYLWNRGDVVAFRVSLNDNIELAWHQVSPRFQL
jgi:hypothetical protein